MKSLKLASFAALFLFMIVSCTKDSGNLTSENSSRTTLLGQGRGSNTGAVGESQGNNQGNNGQPIRPVVTPTQVSPTEAKVGEPVTIKFTATNPDANNADVNCGKITIYQVENGVYTEVKKGTAPSLEYTFTPQRAGECAYQFVAGFAPGAGDVGGTNCSGSYKAVDETEQTPFCVKVTSCVSEFTIQEGVSAVPKGDGLYEFTITYTLTSPVAYDNIKFQGGATSGGQFEHELTGRTNLEVVHNNKQNTVLKYEGPIKACEPVTVSFKYIRKFSCPATDAKVTGDWTVKSGEEEIAAIAPLTYSCQ